MLSTEEIAIVYQILDTKTHSIWLNINDWEQIDLSLRNHYRLSCYSDFTNTCPNHCRVRDAHFNPITANGDCDGYKCMPILEVKRIMDLLAFM
jgi:hypothetical protein